MNTSQTKHYEWLVERRAKNQDLLRRLCIFGEEKKTTALWRNENSQRLFVYLVGSAFSLWRAAFLSNTKRSWDMILDDAQKLLHRVIGDNAVAYPQDKETKEWMGGYYLNNARFRLVQAHELLALLVPDISESEALTKLIELDKSGTTTRDPTKSWDVLHEALDTTFKALKTAEASPTAGREEKGTF
jgi:hypothetical protein